MQIKVKSGITHTMDETDNPTFDEWMSRIDKLIWRFVGLSVHDLPDCQFRKWYDKRMRPIFAANRALKNAGSGE